jgi:formate C-acetyltransferase
MPCSAPANLGVTHRQLDGQDGRYIDRDNEVIVGLQTDQPFKRAIFPFGGLRMVEAGLKAAGFEADPRVQEAFTNYRKTHNNGVFDVYTPEIMQCRKSGIITGLPEIRLCKLS